MIFQPSRLSEEDAKRIEGATIFTGLDECIFAVRESPEGPVAVYDYDLLWQHFVKADACTSEEAIEHLEFNIIRALPYARERRPVVLMQIADDVDVAEEFGDDVPVVEMNGRRYIEVG